jgi:DNA-binding transcriptional regulator YdaS (Cro superfamily)
MKLDKLIAHFGTQVAAAEAIGCTQPTISNWRTRGRIPHLQQLRIEHITGGKLKADPKILKKTVSRP